MTEQPFRDPLDGVASVDELLALPYFELLACLGGGSLHPGGGVATQLLLDTCQLEPSAKVLEIGCGPGWTTRSLIKAGVSVTVVERSPRMIAAMLHYCSREQLAPPTWINASVEDLAGTGKLNGSFDLAILECVVGFIADKRRMTDVLATHLPGGRIGVLDVHYVEPPPSSVMRSMKEVTGHDIQPMLRRDWESMFGGFKQIAFDPFRLPDTSSDSGQRVVAAAGLEQRLPGMSPSDVRKLEAHLDTVGEVFRENKRYLAGHIGVWQVE